MQFWLFNLGRTLIHTFPKGIFHKSECNKPSWNSNPILHVGIHYVTWKSIVYITHDTTCRIYTHQDFHFFYYIVTHQILAVGREIHWTVWSLNLSAYLWILNINRTTTQNTKLEMRCYKTILHINIDHI